MVLDNVTVKEDFDQTVTPDNRVSCNQIRMKLSTFDSIRNYWRKIRLSWLNRRLENRKKDLVTTSFGADSKGLTTGAKMALDRKQELLHD